MGEAPPFAAPLGAAPQPSPAGLEAAQDQTRTKKPSVLRGQDSGRAARALLQITQKELGERAKVSDMTVRAFELGSTTPTRATLDVLKRALEKAGVELLNDGGVRLKRKPKK